MEIKTETVKTFWLSMTETQARDLLNVVASQGATAFTDSEKETKDTIRQALLTAGVQLKRKDT
jgi:hypothetical protein